MASHDGRQVRARGAQNLTPATSRCDCDRSREKSIYDSVKHRDFAEALALADRQRGPGLLASWLARERLTAGELRAILSDVWCGAESPERTLPASWWVPIFRRAGFVSDPKMKRPTKRLTIYRGATPERRLGMAWTTMRERAEWFATRDRESFGLVESTVYVATVTPSSVLALIDGRSEGEVVVDPKGLEDLRAARRPSRSGSS